MSARIHRDHLAFRKPCGTRSRRS